MKKRTETLFVTLPKTPESINADLMTDAELHEKLQRGYDDMQEGRVQNAANAFAKYRKKLLVALGSKK